jgi:hypothetical protein
MTTTANHAANAIQRNTSETMTSGFGFPQRAPCDEPRHHAVRAQCGHPEDERPQHGSLGDEDDGQSRAVTLASSQAPCAPSRSPVGPSRHMSERSDHRVDVACRRTAASRPSPTRAPMDPAAPQGFRRRSPPTRSPRRRACSRWVRASRPAPPEGARRTVRAGTRSRNCHDR